MSGFHHLAVKVRTPDGDWQWVVETPAGFTHSIYPTNALAAERIVEAKLAEPRLTYAVWETRAGGRMIGSI